MLPLAASSSLTSARPILPTFDPVFPDALTGRADDDDAVGNDVSSVLRGNSSDCGGTAWDALLLN